MIQRPSSSEYAPFYSGYVKHVPEGADVMSVLAAQPAELRGLVGNLPDAQANAHPSPGEWSVKEVVGHVCDTERVFAYRALRIARGDETPLAGFDQNEYVRGTHFNARALGDLLDEFTYQRQANVICFRALSEAEISRIGTASESYVSVRALVYMLAGHVIHHVVSLKTDYQISG